MTEPEIKKQRNASDHPCMSLMYTSMQTCLQIQRFEIQKHLQHFLQLIPAVDILGRFNVLKATTNI